MDCETATDIPFTSSDIRNPRPVNSSLLFVDITVTAFCGISAILASVCVIFERYWVSNDYTKATEDAHTNFYDSVVSILASVAACADYLRHNDLTKSAGFKRRNFSVWPLTPDAWSANASFRIGEIRKAAQSLFETHTHQSPTFLLGWAYWFSVASVLFLFFANLLYLMRKDCKTDQNNQSFVQNRRTGYV
ncbi:hypothetical protein CRM22_007667 [Opisthorchis felineus]|uniref:Uncharacterized protein n=1 Tax=Opisthorchis felineus TaxID=147828 RepID=A0A4S2LFF6_OPIFE|nr:hypothetical protein CRM22_007667 [Opisthorchis felineus]